MFYNFSATKYQVEKELKDVAKKDSTYFEIGFTNDSTVWKQSKTSQLGLISVFKGHQFEYEEDLSNKEIDRITELFEREILSKVKSKYYKSE
jgi:hypothetical protein